MQTGTGKKKVEVPIRAAGSLASTLYGTSSCSRDGTSSGSSNGTQSEATVDPWCHMPRVGKRPVTEPRSTLTTITVAQVTIDQLRGRGGGGGGCLVSMLNCYMIAELCNCAGPLA